MNPGIRSMIGSGLVALAVAFALPNAGAQAVPATQQKPAATSSKLSGKGAKAMNTSKKKVSTTKSKASVAASAAAAKPAAAPAVNPSPATPKAAPAAIANASPKSAVAKLDASNNVRAGATAKCKDGTYSHATTHAGACSGHQGVAKWY